MSKSEDQSIASVFCNNIRYAHNKPGKGMVLTGYRMVSLNSMDLIGGVDKRRRNHLKKEGKI